ncbi:MAG: hypothetical protein LBU87_05695 [Lactobacillales bacterium]|jgi:asparagine N-glycosylation enzyme membrane subunit Stt3|nr:hypothetical protein [Lactobacillales bacterium]
MKQVSYAIGIVLLFGFLFFGTCLSLLDHKNGEEILTILCILATFFCIYMVFKAKEIGKKVGYGIVAASVIWLISIVHL